ncbi:MAG: sulfatase-like hydrolase/transferase [Pseudomonadota bacterium]
MNVLVLMCDEMAPKVAWGPPPSTPHLDALAARGMVFDAAYTPSPICVSTRAAIATGRPLHEIGCWSSAEPYDGALPSWGQRLREVGARICSIGKLHYAPGGEKAAFDESYEVMNVYGDGWPRALLRKPLSDFTATADFAEEIGPGDTDYLRFDRRVTAKAVEWLAAPERGSQPWAAFVSWVSPHYPLIAPPEYFGRFNPAEYESDAEKVPAHPILQELAGFFDHDAHFSKESRGIGRAGYYALWSFIDDQVGAVMAALEQAGQADDTLILFTSDHGEMLGEKGFWGKSTMYESSARVPLIAAGPGVVPGRRDDPVSLLDVAPTICRAMGASTDGFSGRSLTDAPAPERAVISEYHDGGASVGVTMLRWNEAGEKWKYVHYAEGYAPQLFELTSDPDELNDLAPQAPERVAAARDRLFAIFDPEDANARAHADQARRVEELGGREAILAQPEWSFTPTNNEKDMGATP